MKSIMSHKSFRNKLKLVKKWGYQCIVCGRPFENLACVTVEHIMPKFLGGKNNNTNTAPAHWRCNQEKDVLSLINAFKKINLIELRHKIKYKNSCVFLAWLNKKVPSRIVPDVALMSIIDAEKYYHDFLK